MKLSLGRYDIDVYSSQTGNTSHQNNLYWSPTGDPTNLFVILNRSLREIAAAAGGSLSLKVHPNICDYSGKPQPWGSLHDLQVTP